MAIRAVIFDLDDTLYDCSGLLVEAARWRAARAMLAAGLPMGEKEAYGLQLDILEKHGPRVNVFDRIARMYGAKQDLVRAALEAYNSDEVGPITPFPDVAPTLTSLRQAGIRCAVVTHGVYNRQRRKIDMLGLASHLDDVVICDEEKGPSTEDCFREVLRRYDLRPEEVAVVGDRLHVEIRAANTLGMTSIQMLHGRFKDVAPRGELEEPQLRISAISELPDVLKFVGKRWGKKQPKIVAIGGGTGLPVLLRGLKNYTRDLTAVVTVTDSGRSSGRLRSDLGMLPPGDIRNCLVALADAEKLFHELFQYRFEDGSLEGMSLGNLLIAALAKVTGSFEKAVKETSRILAIRGKVIPSTLQDTHICAELSDGSVVEEEFEVRRPGKPGIRRVFLKPEKAEPFEEAIEEILKADFVVLGPGSLFTSILSNILVEGIADAIRLSRGIKAYVGNIMTQPGQTDHYKASDHVRRILEYLGEGALDYALFNDAVPSREILDRYAQEGAELVAIDEALGQLGVRVVTGDLVEKIDGRRILWEKQDLLRHDPDKLAKVIVSLESTG